ncbi:DUF4396 domain-containing protein [Nocardioides gilvus]|uniref:DUF4396 domain-containing protein n=1 Tax=Nocardioides gilvus TaxID=1735589 RepID=UPI001EF5188C|nr:DUF4396 domain-containing protein [Nocardioides gilvus]
MDPHFEHVEQVDHSGHEGYDAHTGHDMGGINKMALSATLHCLTGCAIGEIAGLMIGTAIGLSTGWTVVLAVSLAFLFGYTLSTFPLVKSGLSVGAALSVVFAADTLSIATMEVVDNAVMALIPGAMEAGLVNWVFWVSMMIALGAAFLAAYPVNRYLLARGKGHALTHAYHGGTGTVTGVRRYIPNLSSTTLAAIIIAFMLVGLVVSVAAEMGAAEPERMGHASATPVPASLSGGSAASSTWQHAEHEQASG